MLMGGVLFPFLFLSSPFVRNAVAFPYFFFIWILIFFYYFLAARQMPRAFLAFLGFLVRYLLFFAEVVQSICLDIYDEVEVDISWIGNLAFLG